MESSLTAAYNEIAGEVGLFLGYGRGAANGDVPWTSFQQANIDSAVRSGLRQFYFPPPVQGVTDSSYDWSFLKPTATVDFPVNAKTIPMPDDFGGFEGEITLQSTSGNYWWTVELRNEGQIRQMYALTPNFSGRPLMAALQPLKGTTGTQGQRWQLYLFPAADTDYTLQFQYYILPDYLSGAFPYAYGGMAHVETIIESCLEAAERKLDDAATVHAQKFQERLQASISLDRRSKPQALGYNHDRSDNRGWRREWNHYQDHITVKGVQY